MFAKHPVTFTSIDNSLVLLSPRASQWDGADGEGGSRQHVPVLSASLPWVGAEWGTDMELAHGAASCVISALHCLHLQALCCAHAVLISANSFFFTKAFGYLRLGAVRAHCFPSCALFCCAAPSLVCRNLISPLLQWFCS